MTWYNVIKDGKLKDGDLFKASINGNEVLVIKDGDRYYATSLHCTHEQYDLSEGFMDEHHLICPNHFATFNPSDGSVISPPEGVEEIPPLKSYKTKVEDGNLLVDFP